MRTAEKKMYLRKAEIVDLDFLFNLRNEESVRAASFNTDPVTLEEHGRWFSAVLDDPDRLLFILTDGEKDYGQVRLDIREDDCYISYAIVANERGHGLGRLMLELAYTEAAKQNRSLFIIGEVKPENTASRKTFLSLGYDEEEKEGEVIYRKSIKGEADG